MLVRPVIALLSAAAAADATLSTSGRYVRVTIKSDKWMPNDKQPSAADAKNYGRYLQSHCHWTGQDITK